MKALKIELASTGARALAELLCFTIRFHTARSNSSIRMDDGNLARGSSKPDDPHVETALNFIEAWNSLDLDAVLETLYRDETFRYYYYPYSDFRGLGQYEELKPLLELPIHNYERYTSRAMSFFSSHKASQSFALILFAS